MTGSPCRIAFLDRDGVINRDTGYVGRPEDFVLIERTARALQLLRDAGYLLVVVTNQSGIGRGYYGEEDYARVTERMRALLASEGVALAAVLHCPHVDADRCGCRKPQPGMLIAGAATVGGSLDQSVMFGDKPSDVAAGRAAGVEACYLVGRADTAACAGADGHGADLYACVRLFLADHAGAPPADDARITSPE